MDKCRLTCFRCQKSVPFSLNARCTCGGTLLVEYDLERIRRDWSKESLQGRLTSMWRYLELLPVSKQESIVSLGEGWTPLTRLGRLEKELGVRTVWVKREEQNPTGSFKSRGFSAAISLLNEHGIRRVAVPSNGNAASAMAAYAAHAGMSAVVMVPRDCPGIIIGECLRYGADVYMVDGLIHDAGRIIEEGMAEQGWFHAGTLREPGRVEGKKTMGLELAEQLGWKLPDVIIYPTGGGSGIIGIWKAFEELKELGWISGPLPRLVSVQEKGCQPVVDALKSGAPFPSKPQNPASNPTGLRVPNPPDGDLIVSMLKKSNGTAVAVSSEEMAEAQKRFGLSGISSSPEGSATLAGLIRLREEGWIASQESVVLFNTSHADKYLDWRPKNLLPLIRSYEDYKAWQKA